MFTIYNFRTTALKSVFYMRYHAKSLTTMIIYLYIKEKTMKKNIINSALITAMILGCAPSTFADGMPFEPVFESAPINESVSDAVKPAVNTASGISGAIEDSNKLQGALLQLDSAQVDIRNTLIQYKNEYSDIDNQYKLIKSQRKTKKQQVKETEKRIKTLDKTKENIRKSM